MFVWSPVPKLSVTGPNQANEARRRGLRRHHLLRQASKDAVYFAEKDKIEQTNRYNRSMEFKEIPIPERK